MNKNEIPKWNQLIDAFLGGDETPFLKKFELLVVRHHYFRGKDEHTIKQQYGTEPEDFFCELVMKILELDLLRRWKLQNLPDVEVNRKIRGLIRNRIIDLTRMPRIRLEGEEMIDVSAVRTPVPMEETVARITARLNTRQIFIFRNFHKFLQGDADVLSVAKELGLSEATIGNEISEIKATIRDELMNGPED